MCENFSIRSWLVAKLRRHTGPTGGSAEMESVGDWYIYCTFENIPQSTHSLGSGSGYIGSRYLSIISA